MPRTKQAAAKVDDLSPAQRVVQSLQSAKDGSVVKMADDDLTSDVRYYISTQLPNVDYAIGQPGVPSGKVTTIFGPEGSGKSTLAYHLLAEVQRMGGIGILIDSEQRYTKQRAQHMGIDPTQLILIDGATLEGAFKAIEDIIEKLRSDADSQTVPILVVYDSIAGSATDKRMAADVGDVGQAGYVAKFIGAELPRLKLKISQASVTVVLVNQLRSRISMADPRTRGFELRRKVMGELHSMLAEWPLLYESVLMLRIQTIGAVGDKDAPTGIRTRVQIRKCGLSPNEMHSAEVEIDKLYGGDKLGSTFDLLEKLGVIVGGAGGRYRLSSAYAKDDGKTFFRKDFAAVLAANQGWIEAVVKAAPTLWMEGYDNDPDALTPIVSEDVDSPDVE